MDTVYIFIALAWLFFIIGIVFLVSKATKASSNSLTTTPAPYTPPGGGTTPGGTTTTPPPGSTLLPAMTDATIALAINYIGNWKYTASVQILSPIPIGTYIVLASYFQSGDPSSQTAGDFGIYIDANNILHYSLYGIFDIPMTKPLSTTNVNQITVYQSPLPPASALLVLAVLGIGMVSIIGTIPYSGSPLATPVPISQIGNSYVGIASPTIVQGAA